MKKNILLINCYREEAEIKIAGYHEWLKAGAAAAGYDLDILTIADRDTLTESKLLSGVIVSGSQKMVGADEAEAGLLEFLNKNRRPLLGICYGHQVLARAFGCLVKKDGRKHLGEEEIFIKKAQGIFSAFPPVFKMRQSHEEIVERDGAFGLHFRVLAENAAGRVEAIVHREYPLYGVQFHPEKSGQFGIRLLVNFLNMMK
ncbi:MAG: gamma-glutamyl-gamma-aminobutyrate hydrolase family protein [Candidatus Aminicenantes bacterium]|nr:gamma-glutamyl-gamma-aminobutyrate hydrolase family protein [Acidobacteriota bacterium]MCG2812920.1 gamma-glutamyl-gamma-aminobutyrate hydrolase family protein [Candidatus Aminicenantes bacterium]